MSSDPSGGVVRLSWLDASIAMVAMEDRASKNRFSEALVHGLKAAFEKIEAAPGTRAVVIHGYDPYFCCGGTFEELVQLAEGRIEFTAFGFYDLLMRCPVPVIAAMQGHSIGGGLVFGAYADLIVMAEESIYCANFMDLGFTPGLGATAILPLKFGLMLGQEMLLTARSYQGGELRARGAPMRILPRVEVVPEARRLAEELARKPADALRSLKRSLADALRLELDAAVQRELGMHRQCFANPEVRDLIATRYRQ